MRGSSKRIVPGGTYRLVKRLRYARRVIERKLLEAELSFRARVIRDPVARRWRRGALS